LTGSEVFLPTTPSAVALFAALASSGSVFCSGVLGSAGPYGPLGLVAATSSLSFCSGLTSSLGILLSGR